MEMYVWVEGVDPDPLFQASEMLASRVPKLDKATKEAIQLLLTVRRPGS